MRRDSVVAERSVAAVRALRGRWADDTVHHVKLILDAAPDFAQEIALVAGEAVVTDNDVHNPVVSWDTLRDIIGPL